MKGRKREIYLIFHLPKAPSVDKVVMAMDIFKLPPSNNVQMFDAPPLGLMPVKKIPICIAGLSGNKI